MNDMIRFTLELSSIKWCQMNIQFLDEVSFGNRGMLRTHGYSLKGKKLSFRGEFNLKPRISLLCFISVNGLVETFHTDGTLTAPSSLSAAVHMRIQENVCASTQEEALCGFWMAPRSTATPISSTTCGCWGLFPSFFLHIAHLQPYRIPFWLDQEGVQASFQDFDMTKLFEHCGWSVTGEFNPTSALGGEYVSTSRAEQFEGNELLEFSERGDPDYDDNSSSGES
ncbi:hypothetical protein PPTG_16666 [Phytophthora nicotianae INRA-310]|uniref:Uncharacterized protein n=2 Tax=Phytophthora nicotianae TaxID=4792 RepID=W2PLV4_PHYN3|nr:hypothetical protein PPTG_16666 [Phytophthora nicotianae INRA-310]ETN01988.1 hypothetical protein PPTG_16666 [Phytophthora nicotianae INRA-310]